MTPNTASHQMQAVLKSSRPAEKVVVRGSRSEPWKRGAVVVLAAVPREGQSRESLDRSSTEEHNCYLGGY